MSYLDKLLEYTKNSNKTNAKKSVTIGKLLGISFAEEKITNKSGTDNYLVVSGVDPRYDAYYKGIALGDDVERFLNGIPLDQAESLVKGSKPKTAAEHDLRARLNDPLPELP